MRSPRSWAQLVETAESPADLASRADIVGICVWSDDDVRDVMLGDRGVLAGCRPGTVVAIHSTTQPGTCRALADAARELDVAVIDAPVSGGRDGALAGTLVVAVAGDEEAADRCRPRLRHLQRRGRAPGARRERPVRQAREQRAARRQPLPGRRRPGARGGARHPARGAGPGAQAGHGAQLRARRRARCPRVGRDTPRRAALPGEGRRRA